MLRKFEVIVAMGEAEGGEVTDEGVEREGARIGVGLISIFGRSEKQAGS